MQAVIATGSKQFIVKEGDEIAVELLGAEEGQELDLGEVLAILDGGNSRFGAPAVPGASVKVKVLGDGKGPKIRILTYKPKRNLRKHQGHRQKHTLVKVLSVNAGN